MSEGNRETIRRWVEDVWGRGDIALVDELVDGRMVDHDAMPGVPPTREGNKAGLALFHAAFDIEMKLDLLLEDGDYVIDRWTATLTHKGDFFGMPATGKQVQMTGIDISRLENGKIVETWHQEDIAGLMRQLGAMPAPG